MSPNENTPNGEEAAVALREAFKHQSALLKKRILNFEDLPDFLREWVEKAPLKRIKDNPECEDRYWPVIEIGLPLPPEDTKPRPFKVDTLKALLRHLNAEVLPNTVLTRDGDKVIPVKGERIDYLFASIPDLPNIGINIGILPTSDESTIKANLGNTSEAILNRLDSSVFMMDVWPKK